MPNELWIALAIVGVAYGAYERGRYHAFRHDASPILDRLIVVVRERLEDAAKENPHA